MGKQTAFVVIAITLLVLPIVIYVKSTSLGDKTLPSPTPTRTTQRNDVSIVKTRRDKSTQYTLYGRVISVGAEDADGVVITFVLDADPVQTALAGRISNKLATDAISPARAIEIVLEFNETTLGAQDQAIMSSLDAVMKGDWKKLPTQLMPIQSIGVRGRI